MAFMVDAHEALRMAFMVDMQYQGKHPFGSSSDRMTNIKKGKPVDLKELNDSDGRQFVSCLIPHTIEDAHEALRMAFMVDMQYQGASRDGSCLFLDECHN
jgi:hypothetical protein